MECPSCMHGMTPKTIGPAVIWTCPVCGRVEVKRES